MRTINNQELVELLRSTQDNGDGTSTLLFVTLSTTQPRGSPRDGDGGDGAGTLADVPVEHRAGQGDPVPPAGILMFADPAGAAPGTNPAAGAASPRPAPTTMPGADAPALSPQTMSPAGDLAAGLPLTGPGDDAAQPTPARLHAPAAAPAGARDGDAPTALAATTPGKPRSDVLITPARRLLWRKLGPLNKHRLASALAARNEHRLASSVSASPRVARRSDAPTAGAGAVTPGGPRSDVAAMRAEPTLAAAATTMGSTSPEAHGLGNAAGPGATDGDPAGEPRSDTVADIAALLTPSRGEEPRSGTRPDWLGEQDMSRAPGHESNLPPCGGGNLTP